VKWNSRKNLSTSSGKKNTGTDNYLHFVIVFTNTIAPRLQYISDFIGKEICGRPFVLTTDTDFFKNYHGPKINYSYSKINNEELIINNCGLLFEDDIKEQNISCFTINSFKAFYKTSGDYPFDIFAASFYLLSRYEEYLPHTKDIYGRYAYENSLAFKEKFLNLPLINIWLEDFKKVVKEKFPSCIIRYSSFTFLPTCDIDEAYSYKHKGLLRSVGGMAKQLITGNWQLASERWKVLTGNEKDPYDSYSLLNELHDEFKLKPIYFFLVAAENGRYDKNILPSEPAMLQLIKQHSEKYAVGIHPSWQSGDEENLIAQELKLLKTIAEKKITSSRQHYIRFTLPETFRKLIELGITDDYSMGYGSINGFRASVASSFYWYDLENEQQTNLLLHPFCFMEANSYYEQKYSLEQTSEELQHYYNIVKSVNGTLISIWHNSFLGTDNRFAGWREMYLQFIKQVVSE
jgi:hypothetical protein